ncbi:MAG: hypothetical protein AB8I08_27945 [Sandaracinaceae bacterium]
MAREPLVVRLTSRSLERADGLARLLRDRLGKVDPPLLHAFALAPTERDFARELLARHPRFWLYRCHQRRFAGDFLVVDMSARSERVVFALDLKMGARVVHGGGGAGNAFVQLDAAVSELAEKGVVGAAPAVKKITGDGSGLLDALE